MNAGIVMGDQGDRKILGLPIRLRAVLAFQAAGARAIVLLGTGAETTARLLSLDARVRIPIACSESIPEGVEHVVADGVVIDRRAVQSDDGVTVRVRDDASAREAEDALLDSLRKPQDGWISHRLNRHISLAITRRLAPLGIEPNAVSVGILGIGFASGAVAALGSPWWMALGGVLCQAQSVLDGCDGELARLTYRGSRLGEWLDTVGDDLTNYGFFLGATLGLVRLGAAPAALWLGVPGLAAGVLASAIEYRYLVRIGSGDLLKYPLGFGDQGKDSPPSRGIARWLAAVRPAFKRDFFVFAAMCAALATPFVGTLPMQAMLGAFSVGAFATLGAVLASEWRRRGG